MDEFEGFRNVTLSQFIGALQKLEAEYGDKELLDIGFAQGRFNGMNNPAVLYLDADGYEEQKVFVPGRRKDLKENYGLEHSVEESIGDASARSNAMDAIHRGLDNAELGL